MKFDSLIYDGETVGSINAEAEKRQKEIDEAKIAELEIHLGITATEEQNYFFTLGDDDHE